MDYEEEMQLRSSALQNASAILRARERSEKALLEAKEALRHSAERLTLALSVGRMGDWSWDASTDVVTLGPTAAALLGLSADAEFTRAAMQRLVHQDDRERTQLTMDRAIAARTDYHLEYRVQHASGEYLWICADGRVTFSEDGKVVGMVGLIQDIAARKRTEEALEDESRVLELLNKTGAALGSQLDLQALVQSVTDATTQLSGAKFGAFFYNVIDSRGESLLLYALSGAPRSAFDKFGLPRNTPIFNPTFRAQGVLRSNDITKDPRYGTMGPHHGMPKGHLAVCSYLAVPVVSRSGAPIGGLFFGHPQPGVFSAREERIVVGVAAQAGVAIDNARLYEAAQKATEAERSARAQVERMSELKDEFLATLSHELRTPLSAILGWTQVVRRRTMNEADLNEAMEIIERNARVQAQLIEDLLDMSRITSGRLRLDVQQLDPMAFIEAAIETVRPAATAKNIKIEKLLDPDAGPISGDPGRMQQVMWNLLSNAIKFTPKGGRVQVVLELVNSHVEIRVADTGMGIKPEFLQHLFERFRQADASSTRRTGGLGLGLSIVKQLVELHGGTVRARSDGENNGTTFTVQLPLRVVYQLTEPASTANPASAVTPSHDYLVADLSGLKVLVVDDEPDACELLRRVLTDCQAEVRTAANGPEALELAKANRPDVVVSDVGMPGMDGYEFIERLNALLGGRTPSIALTAFARSKDRTRALRAGFNVHLSKPVEPLELVTTVASVAGRPTTEP